MILFYLLILSLPMVDHPQFGYEIHGITVEKFLGVACFFVALCYLPSRRSFPQFLATAQARVFVAFTIMAVTSYVFMVTPFDWHGMVGNIFTELVFFIATCIFIDSRQRLENSVLMLVAAIGLASLYLIKEWVTAIPLYGLSYRPGSVAGDPNIFSASAVTVLPIMVAFALGRRGWKRSFGVVCLGVTLLAILLAASRGAFLALAVLMLLQMRDARHRGKFVAIGLVILLLFLISPVSPLDRLIHPSISDTQSSELRLQLWSISFRIIADHPILGVGLWQFAPYMHKYMPPGLDLQFYVPHNTFLQTAVELGLVGLALFLAIFFFTLVNLSRLRKVARSSGDVFMYSLATALGNGIVAFAVAVFFVSAIHARVFWFAVFLSTCLPAFLAKAVDKKAADDCDPAGGRAAVAAALPLAAAKSVGDDQQHRSTVKVTGEDCSSPEVSDDIELQVDQLKIPR